jgi:hypothetical protein
LTSFCVAQQLFVISLTRSSQLFVSNSVLKLGDFSFSHTKMIHLRLFVVGISLLAYFANAELQFGKAKPIPPEADSSAQYRSVIMPKIFGGGLVEKPLKTVSNELIHVLTI